MRAIRFQFEPEAAVQACCYLLERLGGSADKIKVMKLMYLADRDHFVAHGRPTTGDAQWALPHGPVPSCTLNLLGGIDDEQNDFVSKHVACDAKQFRLVRNPGTSALEPSDVETLEATLKRYGSMHTWAIRELTHKLPEYVECEVPQSSAPIPYEVILKYYGGEKGYRSGRPVISTAMQSHMLCPFPRSEPDL